jgi:hypothetical protein
VSSFFLNKSAFMGTFVHYIHDAEPHPETMKLIKSFCGGPEGGFLEKSPMAAGGKGNFIEGELCA